MSISVGSVVATCDGGCNRGGHHSGTPAAAAAKLRREGWIVQGDGPLAACWCPECVEAGKHLKQQESKEKFA